MVDVKRFCGWHGLTLAACWLSLGAHAALPRAAGVSRVAPRARTAMLTPRKRAPPPELGLGEGGAALFDDEDEDEDDGDDELVFDPDDVFDPAAPPSEVEISAPALSPADKFVSERVPIELGGGRALSICRPADDAVLELLMVEARAEAMADGGKDFDGVMQRLVRQAVEERPRVWFWSMIWPSSVAFARWLSEDEDARALLDGREVCDFGAGLGLAGVAAARIGGAASVELVDGEPQACEYAAFNAALNGVGERARTVCFEWDALPLLRAQPADGAAARGGAGGAPAPCDVLIACDVVYDAAAPAHLARCASALVRPGGAIVLVDETARPYGSEQRLQELRARLEGGEAAWQLAEQQDVAVAWQGKEHRVAITLLRRLP